jgi:mevalonate kinase
VSAVGFAPGKVILLGEHAVVFGRPALAATLPFGVTIRAEQASAGGIQLTGRDVPRDDRIQKAAALVAAAVGVQNASAIVETELTPGGGLGSSAAFAIALTKALASLSGRRLSHEELAAIGLRTEELFHGRPSGVDPTVIAWGGIIRYWKGPPPRVERITARRRVPIVIGMTGLRRSTGHHVLGLAQRVAAEPAVYDPWIDRLGELAAGAGADLESGDLTALGGRMNEAHELLRQCGVSIDALDVIAQAARSAGALGAKLTGAGGGGAAIALAPDPEPVLAAIREKGFEARFALLGSEEAGAA